MLPISKKKPNCLIFFSGKQCSIIDRGSEIPSSLHPKTDKSLSNIMFTEKEISKNTQNLDSNKAHGRDVISIRMLKICGKSIKRRISIIYKKYIDMS